MNTDIRLSIDFWTHPKTFRLERRCGFDGPRCLQILWLWVARNRPDGSLADMDGDDIEFVSGWRGEPGAFVSALKELRWLDVDENGAVSVHDWQAHNSWAASADKRGDEARLSRLFRENPEPARQLKDMGVTGISPEEYQALKYGGLAAYIALRPDVFTTVERPLNDSAAVVPTPVVRPLNARSTNPSTPAPAPVLIKDSPPSPPSGGGERDGHDDEGEPPERPPGKDTPPCPHERIVALYHEILPQCPKVKTWNGQGRKQLAVRWREDKARQNLEWWRHVFEDVAKSDFLMGRRPNTNFLFSLGWFVGPKNFEKVLNDHYVNHDAPVEPVGKQIGGLTF